MRTKVKFTALIVTGILFLFCLFGLMMQQWARGARADDAAQDCSSLLVVNTFDYPGNNGSVLFLKPNQSVSDYVIVTDEEEVIGGEGSFRLDYPAGMNDVILCTDTSAFSLSVGTEYTVKLKVRSALDLTARIGWGSVQSGMFDLSELTYADHFGNMTGSVTKDGDVYTLTLNFVAQDTQFMLLANNDSGAEQKIYFDDLFIYEGKEFALPQAKLVSANNFDYHPSSADWSMSWNSMFFPNPEAGGPTASVSSEEEALNGSGSYKITFDAGYGVDGGAKNAILNEANSFKFEQGKLYSVLFKISKQPEGVTMTFDCGWSWGHGGQINLNTGAPMWKSADKLDISVADRGDYFDVRVVFVAKSGDGVFRPTVSNGTSAPIDILIDDYMVYEGIYDREEAAAETEAFEYDSENIVLHSAQYVTDSQVINGAASVLLDGSEIFGENEWKYLLDWKTPIQPDSLYTLRFRYNVIQRSAYKFGVTIDHEDDTNDIYFGFNEDIDGNNVVDIEYIKGKLGYNGPSHAPGSVVGYWLEEESEGVAVLTVTFFTDDISDYNGIRFFCHGGGTLLLDDLSLVRSGDAPVLSSVSVTPLPEITIAATVPSEKQQKEEPFTFAATASAEPDGALTYKAIVAESGITATWDGNTVTVSAIPFEFADASLDIELKAYPENRSFAAVSKTVSVPVDTPVLPNFVIPGQMQTLYRGRTHTISDVRVTDTEETLIFNAACPITDGEVSWDGSVLTVDVYETCESDYFNVQLTITLERDPRIVKTTMLVFKVQDAVYPEIELPSANVNIVKGNTKDFPLIVRYDGEVDVFVSTQAQGVVLAWEDDVLTVTVPEAYEGESIVIAVKASAKDYEDCETEAQLTLTVSAIGESTVDGDSNVPDFENPEDKDPVPVGLIVGCSAAGVVVIGGAVWLVVWLRKRKSLK